MTLESGVARLLEAMAPLPAEAVPVGDAGGRVLAGEVTAAIDLPSYDNSAMDGFAVRSADAGTGSRLKLIGSAPAGRPFSGEITAGTTVRVFTGSPLPPGADAVVMQEDTRLSADAEFVEVSDGVKPWENVRFRGEDVRSGTLLAPLGQILTPQLLGLLAAQGVSTVPVTQQPRVALLPNGSELVAAGAELAFGQVYESNTAALRELLSRSGAEVVSLRPPPDDLDSVAKSLRDGFDRADLVITIGGASVGEHDLIRPAFARLGGSLEFWKLALKPGKPFFFGTLGGKFLLGLPGNPVSAFVTCVLLVLPALRRLRGEDPALRTTAGVLAEPMTNPDRRRHFVRVMTDRDGRVRPSGPQASHLLRSLAAADGLVDLPAGATFEAGRIVPVIRW